MILGSIFGLLDGTLIILGCGGVGEALTDLELSLLELSFLSFFIFNLSDKKLILFASKLISFLNILIVLPKIPLFL